MAVVRTLRVAPVKGLGSVMRERITIDDQGVAADRRALLIDAAGAVVTLRSHPQLVRVTADVDLDARVLRVTLPDGSAAASDMNEAGDAMRAELYDKTRQGRVLGGAVAEALSEVAGEPIRVLLADQTGVGWDEGPVSILGSASAAAVGGADRDSARYRMLIEVAGTQPFEEDGWIDRDVQVGDAVVRVTHQLQRCVIITQSPATGQKDWEGLHALAEHRGRDLLCLGVIAEVVSPGTVTIGASVSPLDTPQPRTSP